MTPERLERIRQLFAEALALPAEERSVFLRRGCGTDTELLREVESLISQSSSTTTAVQGMRLRETPEADAPTRVESSAVIAQTEDDQFGPYTILRLVGEGGMGTVYLAQQTRPIHRQVALKVVKLGLDSRQVIARFESERQALAKMEHPHIAQIHDAGTSEKGRPYFVMEYVPGVAITQYCDEKLLDMRQRLKIFVTVCEAFQHAHQKGVIHRDIKPSNILVFEQDGKPFPKVIDFGIAKATDQHATEQEGFTQMGSLVGTPEYMSPEQANLTDPSVDTATDVYSLGVLLYQLLVGALPFEGKMLRKAGLAELLRIIREEVPPTPSARITELGETAAEVARCRNTNPPTLRRQLAGDLNWIVMKALEKERGRRYPSMSEFAADIERHLRHEPVLAGAPNALYRARKFGRRHRVAAITGILVATSLIAGLISTGWQAHVANAERRRAEAEAVAARDSRFKADQSARDARQSEAQARESLANLQRAREALLTSLTVEQRLTRQARARELTAAAALARTTDPALAMYLAWHVGQMGYPLPTGWDDVLAIAQQNGASYGILRYQVGLDEPATPQWSAARRIGPTPIDMAWGTDGKTLRAASADGYIRFWELTNGQLVRTLELPHRGGLNFAWSPDGQTLASGDFSSLRLWDGASGQLLRTLGVQPFARGFAWRPDGKMLASVSTGTDAAIRLWDAASGQLLRALDTKRNIINPLDGAYTIAWSPGGGMLASAETDGTVRLWDVADGQQLHTARLHQSRVNDIVWSPDGKLAASASTDGTIQLWDTATIQSVRSIQTPRARVLAWNPDGKTIASGDSDGTIQLWDVPSGRSVRTFRGHQGALSRMVWSADGTSLASASIDGSIRLWQVGSAQPLRRLSGHQGDVYAVTWSPDSKALASASSDRTIRVWDPSTGQTLRTFLGHESDVFDVAWSPDGKILASASFDSTVRLWDAASGRTIYTLADHGSVANFVAWSPDGKIIAAESNDLTTRLWEAASGRAMQTLRGAGQVAWSPGGRLLATASPLRLWEASSGQLLHTLTGNSRVAWSPDGKMIAATSSDGIQMWDTASAHPLRTLQMGTVSRFAWSPNGKVIVSDGERGMRLWDAASGQQLRNLIGHQGGVHKIAWSPDGNMVASAGSDHTIQIWAGTVEALLEQIRQDIRLFTPSKAECRLYFASETCPAVK